MKDIYILSSQGIKLFETEDRDAAIAYMTDANIKWAEYKQKCLDAGEPYADNKVCLDVVHFYPAQEFNLSKLEIGDRVDAEIVMGLMNAVRPACFRLDCAQLGEPYSHIKSEKGWYIPTYATFRCIKGDFANGVWEFLGMCFRGMNVEPEV